MNNNLLQTVNVDIYMYHMCSLLVLHLQTLQCV